MTVGQSARRLRILALLYAFAAAEVTDPMVDLHGRALGLSWVAVWTVLFTVVVPTRPRRG